MRKIINGAKLTFEREKEFLHFQAITEGEMRKEGDTGKLKSYISLT